MSENLASETGCTLKCSTQWATPNVQYIQLEVARPIVVGVHQYLKNKLHTKIATADCQ